MAESCDPLSIAKMRVALAGNAGILNGIKIYHTLIESYVFPVHQDWHKKEHLKSYKRTLYNIENYGLLSIVWKESEKVQKYAATISGLSRTFDKKLNYYNFAKMVAGNNMDDLARCNSWVRSVCMAAEAFLLIERVNGELLATSRLDTLMLRIGCSNCDAMIDLCSALDLLNPISLIGEE